MFAKIKDARTVYRAFPVSSQAGIRRRIDGNKHRMVKHCGKGRIDGRLRSLEETLLILQKQVNLLQNKKQVNNITK